jgi:GTPase SAR1 family protein
LHAPAGESPFNHAVYDVAWSADGKTLASACHDYRIRTWDVASGRLISELPIHSGPVFCIAWSYDGDITASGAGIFSTDILLHDFQKPRPVHRLSYHKLSVYSLAWSRDSQFLASASADRTIRIWNRREGKQEAILEGHTDHVTSVCFSFDGSILASKSTDGTVRLWWTDSWTEAARIPERSPSEAVFTGVSFHPHELKLATTGEEAARVRLWVIDKEKLLLRSKCAADSGQYAIAKVVLAGDTGVGKSGLYDAMLGAPYCPTDSTHGRRVGALAIEETRDSQGRNCHREIVLWDFAGQPDYRVVLQLYLEEVDVALIVFDSRSPTDPFAGVLYWDRALRHAEALRPGGKPRLIKFLVAARCDRGGVAVSKELVQRLMGQLGCSGYFETSAKEGWHVSGLRDAVLKAIDWDHQPKVTSTEVFLRIRQFLVEEKTAGRSLATLNELYQTFCQRSPHLTADADLRAKFETAVECLDSQDIICRLPFGSLVLLRPELLDGYVAALSQAARNEPHGFGCVDEQTAIRGEFFVPRETRLDDEDSDKLLRIAMIDKMIRHEIVIREPHGSGTALIFPSQFTRERPGLPELPGAAVAFEFEGPVLSIYTTLAVRLANSGFFDNQDMWKNIVSYQASAGGTCGICLKEIDEGKGELSLFYDDHANELTRRQFEEYVQTHLDRRTIPGTLSCHRIVSCPGCGVGIPSKMVEAIRSRDRVSMSCPVCDMEIALLDRPRPLPSVTAAVTEMDLRADEERERLSREFVEQGKVQVGEYDVFLAYNHVDNLSANAIAKALRQRSLVPWIDSDEVPPGEVFQDVIEHAIRSVRSAAILIGVTGIGRWELFELRGFVSQCVERGIRVIPVLLPGVTDIPETLPFLKLFNRVIFSTSVEEPAGLDLLEWGITGRRPQRSRASSFRNISGESLP